MPVHKSRPPLRTELMPDLPAMTPDQLSDLKANGGDPTTLPHIGEIDGKMYLDVGGSHVTSGTDGQLMVVPRSDSEGMILKNFAQDNDTAVGILKQACDPNSNIAAVTDTKVSGKAFDTMCKAAGAYKGAALKGTGSQTQIKTTAFRP